MNLLTWMIVGLITGWIAGLVTRGDGNGLMGNILAGMAGGLLGGWLSSSVLHIGPDVSGFNLESILVAFLGAVILLLGLRAYRASRKSFA